MLRISRFLQIGLILVVSVFFNGCYTVVSKSYYGDRYLYSRSFPQDETVSSQEIEEEIDENFEDEEYAEEEEYVEDDDYENNFEGLDKEIYVYEYEDEPYTVINDYYGYDNYQYYDPWWRWSWYDNCIRQWWCLCYSS